MIVSPKLFGYNLECTRRVGYGGLYAEMLQNGKFHAGTQAFYPVSFDGMEGWGQYSERLQVTAGQTYELTAIGGETVHIRLMTEFGTELFSCQSSRAQFTSRFTLQNIRFEAVSSGQLRYVSMRPADAFHGCRRDVLDALKELRPGFLRVPGGCFAERYVWKDGLLPIEDRPVITDGGNRLLFSSSFGQDTHELNIDDYAAICRYVGAEMEFTVRLSDNDPQDAADLVEYCNGDSSTVYGALRAARGYPEPYNVKTWYIGNELAYLSTSALSDANHACTVNDRFVEAMRKVDPSIRTVVSTGNFSDWDTAFVKAAKQIDLCSHHYYLFDTHPEVDLALALRAANEITLPRLEHASSCISNKRMCFDEWNLRWGSWGSAASAVYAAGVTTMVLRNAERLNVDSASYFAPINEGAIRVYPDMVRLAPDGEILKRMALHVDGTLCTTADECSVETKHDGWRYHTVYNPSADEAKSILPLEGEYELLVPAGDQLHITSGEGVLNKLPPAAVAFVRIKGRKGKRMFQKLIADGHFLYYEDGKPFFYLADTAWEMIHRLTLEETRRYLADRSEKGFTVIQTVLIGELNGLTDPNANGDLPFQNGQPVEAYFRHVDTVLDEAEKQGLFLALLPSWGCYWQEGNPERILTPENAAAYGQFLGKRYRNSNVIWVLGGDRIPQTESDYATIRELAKGIRAGDDGRHLMTFHPIGAADSSEYLHNEEWLDFNMCQSSHAARDHFNGAFIRRDWNLQPIKPALDGEPRYERIPVGFYNQGANPGDCFDDFDTRQAAYFAVFSGACGHTYGNNNIWQMYAPGRKGVIGANIPWYEAIHHPGSRQAGYLRKLMEENDFTHLEDAGNWLFDAPAAGGERVLGRISTDRKRMLVYSPYGKRFGADCTWAKGRALKQSWFNCAYGVTTHLHTSATGSLQTFIPPTEGRGCDWVLILEAE